MLAPMIGGFAVVRFRGYCARLLCAAAVVLLPHTVAASPAVDGTRNLSLGNVSRGSAYGTNAALINPAAMAFSHQFAVEPLYQLSLPSQTHGMGVVVMDTLNNPRLGLALGYIFMRGSPQISFTTVGGEERELRLSHFGHEAFGVLSITIVKQWLAIGVKPKYQYTSLRFRDDEGNAQNAHDKLNFFGLDAALGVNLLGWASLHVVATNLAGNHAPAYTEDRELSLTGFEVDPESVDHGSVSRVSDYPLSLAHGLSVFPLHHPDFSLNFDGVYDFTSYWEPDKYLRMTYGGSAEYVVGPVPLRFGTFWDGRGPGKGDDRVVIAGGLAYVKPAQIGGVGLDIGIGFQQDVRGDGPKETVLGLNIGLRIHPDL